MTDLTGVSKKMQRGGVAAVMMACLAGGVLGVAQTASAQADPLQQYDVINRIDSGPLGLPGAAGGAEEVVFSATLTAPGAGWARARFDAESTVLPSNMRLRITSLKDNNDQHLTSHTIEQWKHKSAYLNGDTILIEVLARPGEGVGRVVIDGLIAGSGLTQQAGFDSICGSVDDRTLSSDPRNARLLPVGCTAWIIDDCAKCFLTAGHCTSSADVVEFNVPLSSSSGSLVFAAPEDQYPVDDASMQSNGGLGIGNDWAYFGTHPNSDTGLTAGQAQGEFYRLALEAPTSAGDIRITGYGSTFGTGAPLTWNQVQKTHTGPFVEKDGFGISYQTDTTGGNSGSPVLEEATGLAIGIHTHAGCSTTSGNNGTAIDHNALQDALADPRGVCCPPIRGIEISVPDLDLVGPDAPFNFEVVIMEVDGPLDPGSAELFYSIEGGAYQTAALVPLGGDRFQATFPALDCGETVEYYVRATSDGRETIEPFGAPATAYDALSASAVITSASQDFETAPGWSTVGSTVSDGGWELGEPDGFRGAPSGDGDGSGNAYITGADRGQDLDGGPAVLTSPIFDLSGAPANSVLSYDRWFYNDDQRGGISDQDRLVIEISDNAGSSWTMLESVDHAMGGEQWTTMRWNLADIISLTSQVQLRFTVSDSPNDSITEAGIDALSIIGLECGDCRADFDGDGALTLFDFLAFQNAFDTGDARADFDGDGELTLFDFLAFQNAFDTGC
ncbi:MAG: GC-type dockerin domain-anchored protein [Phycisphaerales bacterium JB064]